MATVPIMTGIAAHSRESAGSDFYGDGTPQVVGKRAGVGGELTR